MSLPGLLVLAAAALVQVTLAGRIDPSIPEPNLVLALVAARAFRLGGRAALGWALAGGLLLDLGANGPVGVHALAMLAAAYVAGLFGEAFDHRRLPPAGVAGAAGAAAYSVTVLGAADFLGLAVVPFRSAALLTAGSSAVSGMLTTLVALGFERLGRRRQAPW